MAPSQQHILTSVLEDDMYKMTMGQFILVNNPGEVVTFGFKNRTHAARIADIVPIERLRDELEHRRSLRLTDKEANWLRSGANFRPSLFHDDYVDFLQNEQKLPELSISSEDGQYRIQAEGPWSHVTNWEIPVLKTVNALYFEAKMREVGLTRERVWQEGERRLREKLRQLKEHGIRFVDFGNRRAFHPDWHRRVLEITLNEAPEVLLATSNMKLAMEFGIPANGTNAHELYMVYARLFGTDPSAIRGSFRTLLEAWWDMYGEDLAIVLTDTYGSEFCFRELAKAPDLARRYRGARHDSGDAIIYGERAIRLYQELDINPREKTIVFSDGLVLDMMLKLHAYFHGRIGDGFGWGTTYTNDLGFRTLSIIMKAIEVNGLGTVKLSDNPAKAQGAEQDVALFKRVHGYTESERVECMV